MEKTYQIGYTTGVFDLFHLGHLNLLRRAKERCAHLIVGVSTDELVEDYKHKRPVVPFAERFAIVEAIRYVDEVIPQTDMDKIAACKRLNAQAVFVGDDWKGSERFRLLDDYLRTCGGQVVYLPHTDNISSTLLREKLFEPEEGQP